MLDDLRPLGLHEAARRLGIEPFEVVRMLVALDAMPERLELSDDHVAMLREAGGISWWWADRDPPGDAATAFRAAMTELVERGHVGDAGTRIDNLWRGLGPDLAGPLQQAVAHLVREDVLRTASTARGVTIAAVPEALDRLARWATGAEVDPALDALWSR